MKDDVEEITMIINIIYIYKFVIFNEILFIEFLGLRPEICTGDGGIDFGNLIADADHMSAISF